MIMSSRNEVWLLHLATQLVNGPLAGEPIEMINRTGRAMTAISEGEFRAGSVSGVLANEPFESINAVGKLLSAMTDQDRQAVVHRAARKAGCWPF
jgi:hypothetical protein